MRKAFALTIVTLLLIPVGAAHAALQPVNGIPVVTAEAAQRTPDISGSWVVWEDERWGYDDLWVKNLATGQERRLSAAAGQQAFPAISGTRVVAEDYRNGINSNLYQYDAATGAEAVISPTGLIDRYSPDVHGDRVVWADQRTGNYDVYSKNLTSGVETRLVSDGGAQQDPAVGDTWAVWHDKRTSAGSNGDIYGYKFSTGAVQAISTDAAMQEHPDTSGNVVVWQDYRNDNWDIFARNMSGSETAVCANVADQTNPAISGNWVVWQDLRNGNYDIYAYNLSTRQERAICTAPGDQTSPAISGDWVVWQDERNGSADIYAKSLVGQADLATLAVSNASSAQVGQPITVYATVANQGEGSSAITSLGIYLSSDSVIDRSDRLIGTASTPALSIGGSLTLTAACTVPLDAKPGSYYVGAIADYAGAVIETSESDNAKIGSALTISLPAHDSFYSAQQIAGIRGSHQSRLTHGATKQAGEPKHAGNVGGRSVWYRWTAPSDGYVTFDLAGSNFDTVMGAYRGWSVDALTLMAANDDVGARLSSRVRFAASRGVTYFIAVDGFNGASGTTSISWTHQALSVTTPKTPTKIGRKKAFTASGYLKPRHRAGTYAVTLKFYRYESGKWRLKKTVRAKVSNYSSYSRYSVRTSLRSTGKWRVQAQHGDADHVTTYSGWRSIRVK